MTRSNRRPYSLDRMLAYGEKNEAYVMGYAELDGTRHGGEPSELFPLYDLLSERLLPQLSEKHQAVLEALFWEQVSGRAYARRVGRDERTVRRWRGEALTQLRTMLKEALAEHASEAA